MNLESVSGKVDEPDFRNAGARVQGQLRLAVVRQRRIRHLDHQENIADGGVFRGVEVVAKEGKDNIRLRRRVIG